MPAQISIAMALSLTLLTQSPASAFTFAPSSSSLVFPSLLSSRCPSPGAPASFSGAPARPGAALGAEQRRTIGGRRNAARRHGFTAVAMGVSGVVDELVQLTNPGLEGTYDESTRTRISQLVRELDADGRGKEHLKNPLVNGVYNVQYVEDVPGKGTPVGGGFRYSAIGKALFQTEDALQIVDGGQGVNLLYFKFLKTFSGCITLRGDIVDLPLEEKRNLEIKYGTPPPGLSSQTLKIAFDSPRISFGSGPLNFAVGPQTTVFLDTTYVDERMRIGSNRFGAHFVFTRLPSREAAVQSAAWPAYLAKPQVPTLAFAGYAAFFLACLANPSLLAAGGDVPRRLVVAGVLALAVPVAIVALFSLF